MAKMKIIALLLMATLSSCGGGGGKKFLGKWKPLDERASEGDFITISKQANAYRVVWSYDGRGSDKDVALLFVYDKDRDILTVDAGRGEIIDAEYNKKSKRMKMGPRGGGGWGESSVEFERIK